MSTRATYNVFGATFYCHSDGYPEGAAQRFANMIAESTCPEGAEPRGHDAIQKRRGGSAYAFIRGNLDAEGANGNAHEGHGDTEWRYTLFNPPSPMIEVWNGSGGAWLKAYIMPLDAFVNEYGIMFDCPRIVRVPGAPGQAVRLATLDNAIAIQRNYAAMAERFQDTNPNKARYLERAQA